MALLPELHASELDPALGFYSDTVQKLSVYVRIHDAAFYSQCCVCSFVLAEVVKDARLSHC